MVLIAPEPRPSRLLWSLLLAGMVWLWRAWALRGAPAGTPAWGWALAGACLLAVLAFPRPAIYHQLLLGPVAIVYLQHLPAVWRRGPATRATLAFVTVAWLWPYVAAAGLFAVWSWDRLTGGPTQAAALAHAWPLPWLGAHVLPILLLPALFTLPIQRTPPDSSSRKLSLDAQAAHQADTPAPGR